MTENNAALFFPSLSDTLTDAGKDEAEQILQNLKGECVREPNRV